MNCAHQLMHLFIERMLSLAQFEVRWHLFVNTIGQSRAHVGRRNRPIIEAALHRQRTLATFGTHSSDFQTTDSDYRHHGWPRASCHVDDTRTDGSFGSGRQGFVAAHHRTAAHLPHPYVEARSAGGAYDKCI